MLNFKRNHWFSYEFHTIMITQFWLYFLGAGLVMRVLTPPFHFKNKTVTHYIRKKTNKTTIHHLHFGLLFAIAALLLIIFRGINNPLLFVGAFGLSLIADEVFIIKKLQFDYSEYFTKKSLLYSILGHLIIGIIITLVLVWVY